jgi:hypothetical protein
MERRRLVLVLFFWVIDEGGLMACRQTRKYLFCEMEKSF